MPSSLRFRSSEIAFIEHLRPRKATSIPANRRSVLRMNGALDVASRQSFDGGGAEYLAVSMSREFRIEVADAFVYWGSALLADQSQIIWKLQSHLMRQLTLPPAL
jgi:hypothetical protein